MSNIKTILVLGLPGSGKTTFAKRLHKHLPDSMRLNGDVIRDLYQDYDFSIEGRIRQARRLRMLAFDGLLAPNTKYVIIDFVCPLSAQLEIINPNYIIWINTVIRSQYEDTDNLFTNPNCFDLEIPNYAYKIKKLAANLIRELSDD